MELQPDLQQSQPLLDQIRGLVLNEYPDTSINKALEAIENETPTEESIQYLESVLRMYEIENLKEH